MLREHPTPSSRTDDNCLPHAPWSFTRLLEGRPARLKNALMSGHNVLDGVVVERTWHDNWIATRGVVHDVPLPSLRQNELHFTYLLGGQGRERTCLSSLPWFALGRRSGRGVLSCAESPPLPHSMLTERGGWLYDNLGGSPWNGSY